MSDHLLLMFDVVCPIVGLVHNAAKSHLVHNVLRWDKGNLNDYYLLSGNMLSKIVHNMHCFDDTPVCSCNNCDHCIDIEVYYKEIVHSLITASDLCIPKVPVGALKHYWSAALDEFKQSSITSYRMWVVQGKPKRGVYFKQMKDAKYKYKLALKNVVHEYENRFSDELLDNLSNKNMHSFLKYWNAKNSGKKSFIPNIDGCCSDEKIAQVFLNKFKCNVNVMSVNESNSDGLIDDPSAFDSDVFFTVEGVDNVIRSKLKMGKAAGLDGIHPEHVVYAHPAIVLHLCNLFNLILIHGYVPDGFGKGVIIPLIKDKGGDLLNSDNYRGITISPIISKIFELCVLDKIECNLLTCDQQFGFKKDVGCVHAVYSVQNTVNYFCNRGSNVYLTALDASKAFDKITHNILFNLSKKRNVKMCFIKMLVNWYSKIFACVQWNGVFSEFCKFSCGIRQGGILSPILFNVYVDELINVLKKSKCGCHIGAYNAGCFMYADDLILLSSSLCEMQYMLDICSDFGNRNDISFNAKKSVCAVAGKCRRFMNADLLVNNCIINRVDKFKYLGVLFSACDVLNVDCSLVKQKFYGACNSLLRKCGGSEFVKVKLLQCFCLPLLMYCVGGLNICTKDIYNLNVCWNDAYRLIFNVHRWESVKPLQFMCGDLAFDYLHDIAKLQFYLNPIPKCSFVYNISQIFMLENNIVNNLHKYDIDGFNSTFLHFKSMIRCKFEDLVSSVYL
jgi:Reverse transcriptase (RNA-dependent DNA polymerase)